MTVQHWQKSSYCQEASACLNLAAAPDGTILLRESDAPEEILSTGPRQLHALITGASKLSRTRGRSARGR